jgi:hypothetical protein
MPEDPILRLGMPDCILEEANEAADAHFKERAGVSLREFLSRRVVNNIYTLLGDDVPGDNQDQLVKMCLELARTGKRSVARFIAFQYTTKKLTQRGYDIFLVHAWRKSVGEMSVRLLPFPSRMMLRMTFNSERCMVEIPPLLTHTVPARDVTEEYIATVLAEAWDIIKSDRELKFGRGDMSVEDRDRYYKLHIPLEDLEAADRCFGWLPMDQPYSEIRDQVREEMYTEDE